MSALSAWLGDHATPLYAAGALAVLLAVLAAGTTLRSARRPPAAVLVATLGALLCTAYSGDTSWRFARDHLGMTSASERGVMFAAAEFGLFAMALMARQNLTTVGAPGAPGVLVWVVTGFQVIPAYSETGPVAGTVRAFVGPVLAALLWHLAMGIELRHREPGAASQGLPAVLAREIRERALSRLGLSRRGRDAAQISRDRWTRITTQRAARLADLTTAGARPRRLARARRRLAVAVDRTDAGVLPEQRGVLLDRLAAYRGAAALASIDLPEPWTVTAVAPDRDSVTDGVTAPVTPAPPPGPEHAPEAPPAAEPGAPVTPPVTEPGTQASPDTEPEAEQGVTATGTPVTDGVTEGVTLGQLAELADLAAVARVPVPLAGVPLDTDQLALVLRWLRYRDDPPMSYRQAADMYRALGFKGSEERIRKAWSALGAEDDQPSTD